MKLSTVATSLISCVILPFLGSHATASEQNARWKIEGLVANGNGCQLGDNMAAIIAGDEIQLVFWNMGIYLPANSGLPLAQRKACSVAIAAEIASGFYVKGLKQKLRFGGMKSLNASAAIAAQGSFFGLPLKPLSVVLESGSVFNEISAIIETENNFDARMADAAPWCVLGANPNGLLSTRVVTQGLRESDADDLLLSSQMYDLKYNATLLWEACPVAN
jgi:hypothetical protein